MEKERGAALLGHVVRFAIFHFYLESCFKTLDSHTYSCAMGDSEINWKTYQEGNQKISMLFSRESDASLLPPPTYSWCNLIICVHFVR